MLSDKGMLQFYVLAYKIHTKNTGIGKISGVYWTELLKTNTIYTFTLT